MSKAGAPLGSMERFKLASASRNNDIRAFRVALELLHPDPNQPRTEFGGEKDDLFVGQLMAPGATILQPLVVRPSPDHGPGHYLILAGERRLRAAQRAGLPDLPVILREDVDSARVPIDQLVENLQRQDLSPLDVARGLKASLDLNPDLSQSDLARAIGKDRSFVSHHLALLEVGPVTNEALETGRLESPLTARGFDRLPSDQQLALLAETPPNLPIPRSAVEGRLVASGLKPAKASKPAASRPPASPGPVAASVAGRSPEAAAARPPASAAPPSSVRKQLLPPLTLEQLRALCRTLGLPEPASFADFDDRVFLDALV